MHNISLTRVRRVPLFRRLAVGSWSAPSDPTVYGTVEVDAAPLLERVETLRRQYPDDRVTMTHVIGRAMARLIAEQPTLNTIIRWGNFYRRVDVDVFFQIALHAEGGVDSADLSGAVIRNADRKSTLEIARELRQRSAIVRADEDPDLASTRRSLSLLPGFLLRPVFVLIDRLQYGLNLRLPGMPRDPFGSVAITNVGTLGISEAFAPLYPPSRCPLVMLVGAVKRCPRVVERDGEERIEIGSILPLHVTFDHRIMDGLAASKLARRLRELLLDPAAMDEDPSLPAHAPPSAG